MEYGDSFPWVDDQIDEESAVFPSCPHETFMVGFVIANIVGVQHYSGTIRGRELVGLVREPLNPYDDNAIKVLNTRLSQVGHIERAVAAVLAPLIDDNMISIEGIVPKTLKGNRFKIPCQIHVFTRFEAISFVQSLISQAGLQLILDSDASFGLSEAAVVEEKKAKNKGDEVRSVDEIFKLVNENVKKSGVSKALDPPSDVIKSELFLHQKEGLGWLVHQENSSELPPFWEERGGAFVNVLTNYQTDKRPKPLRGGIFADDMGLGKTLTLLSLIAFDKPIGNDGVKANSDDGMGVGDCTFFGSGSKKAKRSRPSKKGSGFSKGCQIGDTQLGDVSSPRKTTLIVCPPSVLSTWVTQLGEHTNRGSIKVYMHYGERTKEAEELQKYDIVFTTYSTLAAEFNLPFSPAMQVDWWRVILDEAHSIKNANAYQSQAVAQLKAQRRWAVTGTPIQNGTSDLFSLMVFLRLDPFSTRCYWLSLVQRPLYRSDPKALLNLQILIGTISLRRTKDKALIGLPPKTIETFFVDLSLEERDLYDQLEENARNFIRRFISDDSLVQHHSTVLSIILRLRQVCTDIALCPPDLKLLLLSASIEDVSNNPELLQKMLTFLQDGEDLDCPICISPLKEVVITRCAHVFCRSCIIKTITRTKTCCPLCRHPLKESDLFSTPAESSGIDDPAEASSASRSSSPSSKVLALLKLLTESRDRNPGSKSVVYSQFRKMLIILEVSLKEAGFYVLRLDGSMSARKRAQVIWDFTAGSGALMVLLASLRASGAGINLTAASRVYLLEPWWNPAAEEQAMDRVHRIGQTEEVKIVRMIARNSIEERILTLQEGKKRLAREAFGAKQREVTADELRLLMAL